jgi:L-seryl-tRNA(Ser) seleniumtransferase
MAAPRTPSERARRTRATDRRSEVPSVDAVLRSDAGRKAADRLGRAVLKLALQEELDEVRRRAAKGSAVPTVPEILATAAGTAARDVYGLQEVVNATGVVLHTGLGRAPLARAAARAASRVGGGYADLEVDRDTGGRGRRTSRAERLLVALTGAEAALAVNNGAAALLLLLAALASRRDVLVSRGELIEIGGEFRLPDIMRAAGARLVEVGTTNRTRAADFSRAVTPRTALVLKVHPSNYRVVGFTQSPTLAELRTVASKAGAPLAYDVGSGLLGPVPGVPADEPNVADSLAQGADVVVCSGDKLLGGPQAGLLMGGADAIERLRRHPIARAVRLDKMTIAALETTLRLYATGRRAELPLWRALQTPKRSSMARARALAGALGSRRASARASEGAVGGGSVPGYTVSSAALVVASDDPSALAARLRTGQPSVFCRTEDESVAFDLLAVPPDDDDRLLMAIRHALGER